jgi:hypothetical protein
VEGKPIGATFSVRTRAGVALGVVAAGGIAGGTTVVVTSFVSVIRTWMMGAFPGFGAVAVLVIASALAWVFFGVLPAAALRAIVRARSWGRWLLSAVAGAEVVILMVPTTFSLHWIASAFVAILMSAAAVLSWAPGSATTFKDEIRQDQAAIPGRKLRTVRMALALMAVFGSLGIHSIYLRRAWQSVLTLGVCALGFVFSPWFPQNILFGFACALLVVDQLRVDRLVAEANA